MAKQMKKRILFCSKNMQIGGMEKALLTLLNHPDMDRYDVTLLLEEATGPLLASLNPQIRVLPYAVASGKVALFRKAKNALRLFCFALRYGGRFDFACCYATYSIACSAFCRAASRNSLLYVHSDYLGVYGNDRAQVKAFFQRVSLPSFRRVAFVSEAAQRAAEAVFPTLKNRFRLIGNLCDAEEILRLSREAVTLPAHSGKTVFLFVGRLEEGAKRVLRLLAAARKLKAEHTDRFSLWILGDGPDRALYENNASDLSGTVLFLGAQTNPYPYMEACDAVVLSSDYEGFPMVYCEALLLKKTLVTTVCAADETLRVDNTSAFTAEKSPDSLCDAMLRVCNGERAAPVTLDCAAHNAEHLARLKAIMDGRDSSVEGIHSLGTG